MTINKPMIDFHSHLMPGVDDGASSIEQTRAALQAMQSEGVRALITTPHLSGSVTEQREKLVSALGRFDAAWEQMHALAAEEFPGLRVERGTEVMLDTPSADLSDPRVRLAGTPFVLVEFPHMMVPPNSVSAIFQLRMKGYTPIIAHPERYSGGEDFLDLVDEWRRVGALLQVNSGSLLGRYGASAQKVAWRLLRRGRADYLASDYHARGTFQGRAIYAHLAEHGGQEQARLLLEVNPERLLAGEAPEPVPLLSVARPPLWRRLFRSASR